MSVTAHGEDQPIRGESTRASATPASARPASLRLANASQTDPLGPRHIKTRHIRTSLPQPGAAQASPGQPGQPEQRGQLEPAPPDSTQPEPARPKHAQAKPERPRHAQAVPVVPQVRRSHNQPVPGRTLPGKGCPSAETTRAGRHRTDGVRRATYGDLFAIREFRALWSAQTPSSVGDQIAQVAIAVLVYTKTGPPALTALAYALTYLPLVIGGPLLSGLADLLPHRQAMITLDLLRAGLVTIMAMPAVPLPLVCTLLFATVLLGPPFAAARSALLPEVVPPDTLALRFTAGTLTFPASQIIGFLAGGAAVAILGPHRALALDALSFCLSAALVTGWVENRPLPGPGRLAAWASLCAAAREGSAIVFGDPRLRTLVLLGWLAGFSVVPEGLAAPHTRSLGGGPLTIGLLMAAMPAGMMARRAGARPDGQPGPADPVDRLARHAVVRPADLQPAAPAGVGAGAAVGAGRRGRDLPAGHGGCLYPDPARRSPRAGVRRRAVRAPRRPGTGHRGGGHGRQHARPAAGGRYRRAARCQRGGDPGRPLGRPTPSTPTTTLTPATPTRHNAHTGHAGHSVSAARHSRPALGDASLSGAPAGR